MNHFKILFGAIASLNYRIFIKNSCVCERLKHEILTSLTSKSSPTLSYIGYAINLDHLNLKDH